MRLQKVNAGLDNRSFQTPRTNIPIDNLKPKYNIPESKVWPHESKIANIASKPMQAKKIVQKTKIVNMEPNHQAQKIAVKQELQRLAQKYPGGINKLAIQKKTLLTAPKTKTSVQLAKEIVAAPIIYKTTKVANMQIQKTKPQVKTPDIQKIKLENDNSPVKNKVQDEISISKPNTKIISTPVQDTKTPENTPKLKSPASEIVPKSNPIQEKKAQNTQKDNEETAAKSVDTQSADQSKTEEPSKSKLELDPLLARAVEEELQDIMIQVWRELPDDPSDEDRIAVDKLRNEAGDDFRRVLGLNITKRLLNVYNNLFVKMQFTCRPQMGCLTSFLNKYHINKFKRIDKNSNTFAAQMENIEDFDKLCTVKEIMCGEAKVSITPCYKFTECPEDLKTIYDDTYFYEDTVQSNTKSQKSKSKTQKGKANVLNENVIKPAIKVEKVDAKSTNNSERAEVHETPKSKNNAQKAKAIVLNENVIKPEIKVEKVDAKSTNKPERVKVQETLGSLANDTKCIKNNSEKIDLITTVKSEGIETQKSTDFVCNDPENVKIDLTTVKKEKSDDSSKMITNDIKSREEKVTENITNEKEMHKDIAKDKDDHDVSDYIIKDKLESDDDGDLDNGVPECEMEGDEELDDEDILALMSEGVVLDECSGSEDEK